MKKLSTLILAFVSMMAFRAGAQNEGFIMEMMYPMNGSVYAMPPYYKVTFGHDLVIQQLADTVNVNTWINRTRYEAPMDAKGRFTKFKIANWDLANNKWANSMLDMQFTYTYNASNKLTACSRTNQLNDTTLMKRDMTYSGSGPNGGPLLGFGVDSIKTTSMALAIGMTSDTFTYNGNNLVDYASWDLSGSAELDTKLMHTHNASGKVETTISYYDDGSGGLIADERTDLTYDASGNILSETFSIYNETLDSFEYTDKNEYTYASGTNRMTQQKTYEFGPSGFELNTTMDFFYDATQRLDSAYIVDASETKEGYMKVNYSGTDYESVYYFEKKATGFVARERYIYTEPATGLMESLGGKAPMALVYPNPSHGTFTIAGVKEQSLVSVYNLAGKLVYSTQTGNGQIRTNGLNSGIYFMTVTNSTGVQNAKLIIE